MKNLIKTNRKALLGTFIAATLALTAAPAMAQPGYGSGNGGQQGAMQGQQPTMQDFDEATLEKFASAASELGRIQNDFAQKLKDVQEQQKAMEMQKEVNKKMVKAVQEKGLEVQTYNAIANQLSVDEELRSKVEGMIQANN